VVTLSAPSSWRAIAECRFLHSQMRCRTAISSERSPLAPRESLAAKSTNTSAAENGICAPMIELTVANNVTKEKMMRPSLLTALAVSAFGAITTVGIPAANAVVYCAAGVVRAGCVARPVVRPVVAPVRGVARRTTRRVVRRSDMMLKHDVSLLGQLDNGIGFYRFGYNGSDKTYVGVMAQQVQTVVPTAVVRGRDGYLRVDYDKLGVKFETYDQWVASGAHVPAGATIVR
jgi:hypothetical protein